MDNGSGNKVALIVGAGYFLGGAIAKRFFHKGFHSVCTRRRGSLSELVIEIQADGDQATAFHSDARDEQQVAELVDRIEREVGPIEVCVHNIGANVRFPVGETTARVFRKVWEMCALSAFLIGREVSQRMRARGNGTILFIGASASLRGLSGFSAFSGGMQAKRALAQSMARELAPQGIHVAHVVIDGPIDNDATRELFLDWFESRPEDGIMKPDDLAEIYWNLHQQPRGVWSFETDVRSNVELW